MINPFSFLKTFGNGRRRWFLVPMILGQALLAFRQQNPRMLNVFQGKVQSSPKCEGRP